MWLSKPSRTEIMDGEYGTGEYVNGWSDTVEVRVNASAPSGDSSSSPFGTQVAYDLQLVAESNRWGIDEGDRMWLGDRPELLADGQPSMSGAYEVKRVSPSLNYCAFGLTRVDGR
jgi:hypothetical protein